MSAGSNSIYTTAINGGKSDGYTTFADLTFRTMTINMKCCISLALTTTKEKDQQKQYSQSNGF